MFASGPAAAAAPGTGDDPAAGVAGVLLLAVLVLLALGSIAGFRRLGVFRPGGLDRRAAPGRPASPPRDVEPLPAHVWLFAAAVVWLTLPMGASAGAVLVRGVVTASGGTWAAVERTLASREGGVVVMLLAYGIAAVASVCVLGALSRLAPRAGFVARARDLPRAAGWLLLGLPVVVLASVVAAWVASMVRGAPPDGVTHTTLSGIAEGRGDPWVWGTIAAVTIGAPIVEEVVYRGLLQSACRRLTGSGWLGVLLASVVFTAVHWGALEDDGRHAMATLFVLSLLLGIAFERTRSILVPIVMHAGFNAFNIALVWLA